MSPSCSESPWTGFTRFIPLVLLVILISSIVTLAVGIPYGIRVSRNDLFHPPGVYSSIGELVVSTGLLPVLSIIQACVDIVLYHFSKLNPIYALVIATLWFSNWVWQNVWWGMCYDYRSEMGSCMEWPPTFDYPKPLPLTRIIFAVVIAVLYAVYLGFAASAVHRRRMAKRQQRRGGNPVVLMTDMGSDMELVHA
ncbi:MAG: hypothetical protein M1816_001246 [Peltula sp. TS41687]|nr:MAG: hypothetical protein M1816_001246 [Peltula sp. TS41687]